MSNLSSDLTRLKIWIIFQGTDGKKTLERLNNKFQKHSSVNNIKFHKSSYHRDNAKGSVYERVKKDAVECDAAIAIITNDTRDASSAGNLWFEIGLWLAQRQSNHLIICKQKEVEIDVKDELISDINGKIISPFENDDALWSLIIDFVAGLDIKPNNQLPSYRKIQDIYHCHNSDSWLDEKNYHCHFSNNETCDFREKSFEFSAELLRMGKINHERELLALSISKIACFSGMYKSAFENQTTPLSLQFHMSQVETLNNLSDTLKEIENFGKNNLERSLSSYKDNYEPLDRVTSFLRFRLNTCCDLFDEISKIDGFLESKDEFEALESHGIKRFINFVRDYAGNRNKIKEDSKNQKNDFLATVVALNADCKLMAKLLNALGDIYFNDCRKVLKDGFKNMNDPSLFSYQIKEIIKAFPHNDDQNRKHHRIWNEKITSFDGGGK